TGVQTCALPIYRRDRDRPRAQGSVLGAAHRRRLRDRDPAGLGRRRQRCPGSGPRGQLSVRLQLDVPATSANLGPGYDAFGLALDIVDTLTLTVHDDPGDPESCVTVSGEGAQALPRDRSHLVMRVTAELFAAEFPAADESLIDRIELDCRNRIPHSRGLGSSAAAVVAGIGLAPELGGLTTGARLDRRRILEIATDFEGHPDNAAPAIFGGLTISLSEPARTWQVPVRTIDEVTVLIPDVRLDTDVARSLIPAVIDHDIAAENSARSG